MTFVAECAYCHLKLQKVPEHRLGSSVECPRCHNSFTLVPASELPAVTPRAPRAAPRAEPEAPPVAVAEKPVEEAAPAVPPPPPDPVIVVPPPALDPMPWPPAPRPPNYAGLGAFLLGSFAFLAAALLHSGWVTLALGLVGLLLGPVGLLLAGREWRRRLLSGAGLIVSLSAVVVAVFLPHWLDLNPLRGAPKPPERRGDALMALSGAGGFRPVADGQAPWADASRDALYRGEVRLRVSSAAVGPAVFEPLPGKPPPGDRCLVIGLRITNGGIMRNVRYTGWGGGASGQDRPVLRDDRGRTYAEKLFAPGWVVKGHVASATIPPGKTQDDVLIFEAPPASIEYLRLELPASAVGAEGRLRMEVPRSMIAFR